VTNPWESIWLPLIQCLVTLFHTYIRTWCPHHFSRNCHAQSKVVFFTIASWFVSRRYKSRYTQNKITSHKYTLVRVYSYVCAYLPWYPSRSPQVKLMVLRSVNTHTRRHVQNATMSRNIPTITYKVNRKLPPNTLVRRELPQNHITM